MGIVVQQDVAGGQIPVDELAFSHVFLGKRGRERMREREREDET